MLERKCHDLVLQWMLLITVPMICEQYTHIMDVM